MEYKFSFYCDYELVGYCNDVIGLNADADVVYKEENCYEIKLINFKICDEYLKYLKESKSKFGGSCRIHILDNEGISIGEYRVFVEQEMTYTELSQMKMKDKLILFSSLSYAAVGNEIKLWDKWRAGRPKLNEWVNLSDEDRIGWLNIVMKYHFGHKRSYYEPYKDITGGTYYLDCINITTFESFFCALGEAMNGPGGYYGFDGLNILDCLTGKFGPCRPFKLIWKNSNVALKSLTRDEWESYIKRKEERSLREVEEEYNWKPEQSFFYELIEIFLEYGVTVELEP